MIEIEMPKDLNAVKTKFVLNLTLRQLIFFSLAGLIGVPFYLAVNDFLGTTLSALLMVFIMLPFFFFALYEKDGMPFEKVLKIIYEWKIKKPKVRPYATHNVYADIQERINEEEVKYIESE